MATSILVPIDGSPFSEQALPTAVAIARRTGARLQLVRVHEPVFTGPPFGDMPAPDPAWDREMRLEEEARLRELASRVMKAGVEACAVVIDGPVASALANYVEEVDADLVVMTTHGRNAFSRAWLGSVADVLVRKCTRPVLLLRPGEVGAEALDLDVRHAPSFDHILIPTDGSAFSKQVGEPWRSHGRSVRASRCYAWCRRRVPSGWTRKCRRRSSCGGVSSRPRHSAPWRRGWSPTGCG